MDPAIDFSSIFKEFDTVLVGRRTFEPMARAGQGTMPGMKTFVFSRTLRQRDYPEVTIVADKPEETVDALRADSGKDIWLFGGGLLFRSLGKSCPGRRARKHGHRALARGWLTMRAEADGARPCTRTVA